MKTSELTGAQLDYWVARAGGREPFYEAGHPERHLWLKHGKYGGSCVGTPKVSTDWAQGGQIVDSNKIATVPMGGEWCAFLVNGKAEKNGSYDGYSFIDVSAYDADGAGPTPLIAAMRAYVASKFGDTVPDEPAA